MFTVRSIVFAKQVRTWVSALVGVVVSSVAFAQDTTSLPSQSTFPLMDAIGNFLGGFFSYRFILGVGVLFLIWDAIQIKRKKSDFSDVGVTLLVIVIAVIARAVVQYVMSRNWF